MDFAKTENAQDCPHALDGNATNVQPLVEYWGVLYIQTTQTREKKRLTYREKLEFEQLGKDIEALESERATIHTAFSGATLTPEQITQYSKRLPELETELDTKSARWLELSEYA